MKFKKFLMTLACMVLVVCATFGFVGCAKEVSAEEVKTFMAQAEIANAFSDGYRMKMSMLGTIEMEAEAVYEEETLVSAHCKSSEGEVWLVDGTVYVSAQNSKKKYQLAELQTKNPYIKNILDGLKDETEQYIDEDELNEMIDSYNGQDGVKVKFKKEGSGNNVTFTMNASGKVSGQEIKAEGKLVFQNNKLTKVNMITKTGNNVMMDMYVETFSGRVSAPADASEYVAG